MSDVRARVSWLRSGCWLAVAIAACAPPNPPGDETVRIESALVSSQFALVTPTGDPRATLLSASDSLTLDDRVTIGTASALEIAAAFGTTTTQIAAGVQAHANLTSKPSVFMGSSARVFGFARSGGTIDKQTGAQVNGGEFPNTAITSIPTQWTVTFPDTNQGDVTLEPDQTRTLAPGSWGNLTVKSRSKVFLSAGTYFFQTMTSTEPDAQILLNKTAGAIFIYVKSGFTLKGPLLSNGGPEGEELVGYLGTAIADIESPLLGTIVAPNATVELRRPSNNAAHRGAVFAKGIHVFSDATVIRVPFSWNFLCAAGDTDHDGVVDCVDICWKDPNKVTPGICNCGTPDTDSDHDGIPNCIDYCDADVNNSVRGQCGCAGATAKPAGTHCTDSPCVTNGTTTLTCNGSGVCGNPSLCAPAAGCFVRQFAGSYYWFCPGPATWSQAATNCRALPGRTLARINTQVENDFVRGLVTGGWWTGANDQTTAGSWRWATAANNNGDQFWSGGPTGNVVGDRFVRWAGGQPDPALLCGTLNPAGDWIAQSCSSTTGYVCEQPVAFAPPPVPVLDCGKFFPARACGSSGGSGPNGDSPNCVPASSVFTNGAFTPEATAQAYKEISDCNAAGPAGTCTATNQSGCAAACAGAATVPPPGSTCPAFEAEETGLCGLMNTVETGCTEGVDCCGFTSTALVSAGTDPVNGPIPQGFEVNAAGFTYADDGFRGTGPAAPNYESGVRVTSNGNPGAALQITLGGIDATTVTNLTGAWQTTFTLTQTALTIIAFDYNLSQTPNYEANESSRVLLSLNGTLLGRPFDSFIDQVTGDGDGGPNLTTGWKTFSRNLGRLTPGTYTLAIGGLNNQKNASNESTTILLDNLLLQTRVDSCTGPNICGPAYANGCNPCDDKDPTGKCVKACGQSALRCGQPIKQGTPTGGTANCADSSLFPDALCQQIEICSDPGTTGTSDPTTGGTLGPDQPFNPATLGPAAPTPITQYVPDPPCAGGPPCSAGQNHHWCSYRVDTWNDPVIPAQNRPAAPVTPRQTPPAGKQGSSGSDLITFTFTPDVAFDMSTDPLPFGESSFNVNAHASFDATVGFNLGGPVKGSVDIINAALVLHADRCSVTDTPSQLTILEHDFFPDSLRFTTGDDAKKFCNDTVFAFTNAVDRTKKAYRDAMELMKQYNALKGAIPQKRFPDDFCQQLVGDPPAGFPVGNCGTETAAATINRFILHYRNLVTGELRSKFDALAAAANLHVQIPADGVAGPPPARETQTIFQATFPIGPLPLLLQVEAFAEYGLDANLSFDITPLAGAASGNFQQIANVTGIARPYALAGVDLFVGIGFDVNGFSASAGVEGSITLGRVSLDAHASAGFGAAVTPDTRDLPADVQAAAGPGISATKQTLFPPDGPKNYALRVTYDYGMALDIAQVLSGNISGRLRIKFFFFSKTWRKVLINFPGFSLPSLPLVSGGGNIAAVSGDPFSWGTVQMPLPFVNLPDLTANEVLTGTTVPFDKSSVEELFYDSLCTCKADNAACSRNGDCCGRPTSVCFSDPSGVHPDGSPPGTKFCTACRNTGASCNVTGDCCGNPSAVCLNNVCQCVPAGGTCNSVANCCANGDPGTTPFLACEDNPFDPLASTKVCRTCRTETEPCTTVQDCCQVGPGTGQIRHCDQPSDGGTRRCSYTSIK